MTTQFNQVSAAVAAKVAELLKAHTAVLDTHGIVVASSEPTTVGRPYDLVHQSMGAESLRIPLRIGKQKGEVVVGAAPPSETTPPRLTQVLVELIINQASVVQRQPNQHELKNTFIHDLLHGVLTDEEAILRDARLLGMDFVPPRAVILIDAADYILPPARDERRDSSDVQIRRRAQLVIGSVVSFFQLPNDTICAYIGNGEVAVLKASNTKNLAIWAEREMVADQHSPSWANLAALRRAGQDLLQRLHSDTGISLTIGIGRYHPGVRGLARSYQDARAALSLGRHYHRQNGVHCLDGLGMAAFVGVSDERTKIELATHLLSPLDHEPELLETLDVFFANNCSPLATVQQLTLHRNTLAYRLEKIKSLTGLDPRHFDDAVQIRLAMLLRSFKSTN